MRKLETKEVIKVMQAFVEGKPIECLRRDVPADTPWSHTTHPNWDWVNNQYRVKPTKDSIDWDHVSEEWNFMARDAVGKVYLYASRPRPHASSRTWIPPNGDPVANAKLFASYSAGTVNWTESLCCRPGFEAKD